MSASYKPIDYFMLVLFIVGGILTFSGVGIIAFAGDKDLFGWGEGRGIGYLFTCVGMCLSILAVLIMRLAFRK